MDEKATKYYAHGKLLLTGEYLVLNGAKALALPLKLGQSMEVFTTNQKNKIIWEAFSPNNKWFSCEIQLPDFTITKNTDSEKAELLKNILATIRKLNPEFHIEKGYHIKTRLEFEPHWGLGSSSTLIANLADWTNTNAYRINELIFKGSGYDIACAKAEGPVYYQKEKKPIPVNLDFPFEGHLFFVYSGSKKNTRHGIDHFQNMKHNVSNAIQRIDEISENIAKSKTLSEFQQLISEHEIIVGKILNEQPVQEKYFNDFNGVVKSLGAWGGDFYLAASPMSKKETSAYFSKKGLKTIFAWKELIINNRKLQSEKRK